MVVTFLPATLEIAVMQERVASPLMCTVQAPQSAMPQPNLVPVMFSVSRSTQSRGMSGLTSTDCGLPFKVKLMAMESSQLADAYPTTTPGWLKIGRIPFRPSAGPWLGSAAAECVFPSLQRWRWQSQVRPEEHRARHSRLAVRRWARYGPR